MTDHRPLEREFAERAHRRDVALDRQRIEEGIRGRERAWAHLQLQRDRLDTRTWDRLMEVETARLEQRDHATADASATPFAPSDWSQGLTIGQLRALPYELYLLTDHWQAVRDRALVAAAHRCQTCGAGSHLNVHHKTYERRGDELPGDVTVLCGSCHKALHQHDCELEPRGFE